MPGSDMRATPPSRRMSAGTRSSAITAHGARVLGDHGLLGVDDVHDDAALEHLGETALDAHRAVFSHALSVARRLLPRPREQDASRRSGCRLRGQLVPVTLPLRGPPAAWRCAAGGAAGAAGTGGAENGGSRRGGSSRRELGRRSAAVSSLSVAASPPLRLRLQRHDRIPHVADAIAGSLHVGVGEDDIMIASRSPSQAQNVRPTTMSPGTLPGRARST